MDDAWEHVSNDEIVAMLRDGYDQAIRIHPEHDGEVLDVTLTAGGEARQFKVTRDGWHRVVDE